ncbi:hypothetical protein [Kordia jejudonensis]|uniref:hypothetical protein n=1 Tax=Kordia jejudonensis TaxID=1348245 RepID=UPI00062941CF|nr:hypothetical protein [Kordia jejudonensis]
MNSTLKNRLLVGGFIVLLFICYKFAVANTIALKQEYDKLSTQEALFNNIPKQIAILKKKEQYYDSLLTAYKIGGTSIQNNILNTVTSFSNKHNLKITSFSEPHTILEKSLRTNTYTFTVQGHFNSILQLIYTLEQKTKYGEVISVSYEKKKNYRTGTSYLQATILLQSFG